MIYDECHQPLTSAEFRRHFAKIRQLAELPIQKIGLTATLPVRLEKHLLEALSLAPSTLFLRNPTPQPQIQYHVFTVDPALTTVIRFAQDLVALLTDTHKIQDARRGIIFVQSKREADLLAAAMPRICTSSHSGLDAAERGHNEQSWFAGFHPWIAATTGMIHGVDHPGVTAVIFLELPYGLINVVQGAGRSGRNGDPSIAILINSANMNWINPKTLEDDFECRTEGNAWIASASNQCLRMDISRTMDGVDLECADLGEHAQRCGYCKPDTDIARSIQLLVCDVKDTPSDAMDEDEVVEDQYPWEDFDDETLATIDMSGQAIQVSSQLVSFSLMLIHWARYLPVIHPHNQLPQDL